MQNKGKVIRKGGKQGKELNEMPDHLNDLTRGTEERLGPFIFDMPDGPDAHLLVSKGPFELDNGAIYFGQWT